MERKHTFYPLLIQHAQKRFFTIQYNKLPLALNDCSLCVLKPSLVVVQYIRYIFLGNLAVQSCDHVIEAVIF